MRKEQEYLEINNEKVINTRVDGARLWSPGIRNFLGETFPNRWIGRDGPVPWPPRSTYIKSLDLLLRGYIKDGVYPEERCGISLT